MSKGDIKGLAHIGIFVKDIDASIDFYQRLGFTLDKIESIHIRLAFLSAGTCLIELVEQKDLPPRTTGPVDHFAVIVDDIEAAIACAKDKGIDIDASEVKSLDILGGIKNVFFEGPDGERIEFVEYPSKE
ncbi:MAG: VOC family protein [Defluviitaleaceae bacterium]|nr:VOC family protein [Defluviitaleaceae bacterium]